MMARKVDLGVFLPVTNNGWIISRNSPQFLPSFGLNRAICELAERIGYSYVFSMANGAASAAPPISGNTRWNR